MNESYGYVYIYIFISLYTIYIYIYVYIYIYLFIYLHAVSCWNISLDFCKSELPVHCSHQHIAALAAVAATWVAWAEKALLSMLLERACAVTAMAANDMDASLVNKMPRILHTTRISGR